MQATYFYSFSNVRLSISELAFGGVCRAPTALPPRPRKPLTVIEEFHLQVDKRAVEREEFDKKVTSQHSPNTLYLCREFLCFVFTSESARSLQVWVNIFIGDPWKSARLQYLTWYRWTYYSSPEACRYPNVAGIYVVFDMRVDCKRIATFKVSNTSHGCLLLTGCWEAEAVQSLSRKIWSWEKGNLHLYVRVLFYQ